MTQFGIDIASYQAGLDISQVADEGFEFVIAKVSEGDYYVNPTWPGFRDATRDNGMFLAGYHYVRGDCDPAAQARLFVDNLGDKSIPVMLDHEMNSGGIASYWRVVRAINDLGCEVDLTYMPRWFWAGHMGSPDISAVPGLVSSSYVAGSDYASSLYPGAGWNGWEPYGGASPVLCQFTDRALVAGQRVDSMAYEGDDLGALFRQPSRDESEDDMTPEERSKLDRVHHELTYRFRSRVEGSEYRDTVAGYVLNTDAATYRNELAIAALRDELDAVRAELDARKDDGK